jgi:hypothetical protein
MGTIFNSHFPDEETENNSSLLTGRRKDQQKYGIFGSRSLLEFLLFELNEFLLYMCDFFFQDVKTFFSCTIYNLLPRNT